jgi:hypothetical protein
VPAAEPEADAAAEPEADAAAEPEADAAAEPEADAEPGNGRREQAGVAGVRHRHGVEEGGVVAEGQAGGEAAKVGRQHRDELGGRVRLLCLDRRQSLKLALAVLGTRELQGECQNAVECSAVQRNNAR